MPNGTIKNYIPNGNSFTEDVNGHLTGIEWAKNNGNSFRVITVNSSQYNALDKTIEFTFVKEMKEDGELDWQFKERYHFDGTEYINTNFGNAKYGKMVTNPFLADGITLKPNTQSFGDYFVNYIMKGVNPPIPLFTTLNDIIATKENVTIL